jgi:hypothetical protein
MKGWERDLLDHLACLTMMHADSSATRDEVVAHLKREFPPLAAADQRDGSTERDG